MFGIWVSGAYEMYLYLYCTSTCTEVHPEIQPAPDGLHKV